MSFGITELLIVLAIVLLLFGGRKLKTLGSDLGGAIKGFRKAMNTKETEESAQTTEVHSEKMASEAAEQAKEKPADQPPTR